MAATPSPSVVRLAVPEDYPDLLKIMLQNHKENGLFTLSPKKVQWYLNRAIYPDGIRPGDTGTRGIIGVIGPIGTIEGGVFAAINELWYSEDKFVDEYVVYVDPEFRRSDHAKALIEWLQGQAAAAGLPLWMGVVSTHRTEAKCRLYQRMLPKAGEFFFVPNGLKGDGGGLPALMKTGSKEAKQTVRRSRSARSSPTKQRPVWVQKLRQPT